MTETLTQLKEAQLQSQHWLQDREEAKDIGDKMVCGGNTKNLTTKEQWGFCSTNLKGNVL